MSGHRLARGLAIARVALAVVVMGAIGWAFVALIVAILWDAFDGKTMVLVTMTPGIGLMYGCLGLVAIYVIAKGRLVPLVIVALVLFTCAAVAWIAVLVRLHVLDHAGPWQLVQVAATLTLLPAAVILSARLRTLETRFFLLRLAVSVEIVAMMSLAATGTLLTWTGVPHGADEAVGALLLSWTVLTLVGLVGLPIAAQGATKRSPRGRVSMPDDFRLELSCPRCGTAQALPMGVTACTECRATLVIEVEEPRCECGYLLYRLSGDTCPECGRAVPPEGRWMGT